MTEQLEAKHSIGGETLIIVINLYNEGQSWELDGIYPEKETTELSQFFDFNNPMMEINRVAQEAFENHATFIKF